MRSSDNVEKLFRLLELDTSRSVDEKILSDAGDALETAAEARKMVRGMRRWDNTIEFLKRGAIKAGMAAAIVITATSIWIAVEKMGSPCGVTPGGNRNGGQLVPASESTAGMGTFASQSPTDANIRG